MDDSMNKMLKELEAYGRVEQDSKTWVHPWETYWHIYCGRANRDELIKKFSEKWPDFIFYKSESHICGTIYQTISFEYKDNGTN